jgi:hydroxyacylglutathione hydrolase
MLLVMSFQSGADGAERVSETLVNYSTGAPVAGDLDVVWIHGAPRARGSDEPPIQVHHYDQHTVVLRQSKLVSFEAPFLYLLFGNDRALLLDTGATADAERFPIRDTVDALVAQWLRKHPRDSYELVVAHTHAHDDHISGDAQFIDRPGTTVVNTDLESVQSFFGFSGWPDEVGRLDLGGRVLEVTGCPGHHETSIAVFDPWSGFLLTGDTAYPGRLYVEDMAAYTDSLERLVGFARARQVRHLMGGHVEMRRQPRRDFPPGATYQPGEVPLQMSVEQLETVRDAAVAVADRPGLHRFDDFVILNGRPGPRVLLRYLASALWHRLRHGLSARPRSASS